MSRVPREVNRAFYEFVPVIFSMFTLRDVVDIKRIAASSVRVSFLRRNVIQYASHV